MTRGLRPIRGGGHAQWKFTVRGLWTLIHGMGFGALYLPACSGALVELYRFTNSSAASEFTRGQERFLEIYLLAMVAPAWTAVLTRAYVIYPWYHAAAPPISRCSAAATKVPMLLKQGFWAAMHEARADFCMLVGLIAIVLLGPGAWSVDRRRRRTG